MALSNFAALTSREPLVLGEGVAIPQSLAPPRVTKWWRGEGSEGGCGGELECQQHGPVGLRAVVASSVHNRCPEWWKGDKVSCHLTA